MSVSITRSRSIAWTIWMIASVFYAYQYILRVTPNILLGDIMEKFQFDAATFGQFSGIYYIGYSLLHLPMGIMLDRFGPRKVMTGSILLTVLGLLPLLLASHWSYPIAGRFLIGLGSSAAILGVFKVIRMAFSEAHFARMLSFSATIGLIGAIYGGGPLSHLRQVLGYDALIEVLALAGLALAAFTYWAVPNIQQTTNSTVFADVKEVLFNKKVLAVCIFAGLMVGPLEGFADVWGSAFLRGVYGYEGAIASSLPSLIFVGMCFGAPFLSLVAEKTKSYIGTIIGSAIAMALLFALLCLGLLSSGTMSAGFIVVGVCSAYQILAITYASLCVRSELAGLTTALANMIIMVFGYAFHTLIGTIVNAGGGAQNSSALTCGVSIIPLSLCLGAAGFILLSVRKKKSCPL